VGNKNSRMSGRGAFDGGEGTDATARQNSAFSSHTPGAGTPPASGASNIDRQLGNTGNELALHQSGGSTTGEVGRRLDGRELGETGEGRIPGERTALSIAPPDSALIQIIAEHRRALRAAKSAIEKLLGKLPMELRPDLAVAACKMGHVLRGGMLLVLLVPSCLLGL
jgi:hypothetical protein